MKRILFSILSTLALIVILYSPVASNLTGKISNSRFTKPITIAMVGTAEAASADYICDGTDDNIEIQQALDDLPSTGGKIVLWAGSYSFSDTVARNIDDVTFEGGGAGTYLTHDGTTALISAGLQDKWLFKDIRTDGGALDIISATDSLIINSWIGETYVNSSDVQYLVDGVYVNGYSGVPGTAWPIGTPGLPVDNIEDAIAILEAGKLSKIYILDDNTFSMPSNAMRPTLVCGYGIANGDYFQVDVNGKNGYTYNNITLYQYAGTNNVYAEHCTIELWTWDSLYAVDCVFLGSSNATSGGNIFAQNSYFGSYVLDCKASYVMVFLTGAVGSLMIKNFVGSASTLTVYGNGLNLHLFDSCTAGTINIYGNVTVTDDHTGTCVVNDYSIQTELDAIKALLEP